MGGLFGIGVYQPVGSPGVPLGGGVTQTITDDDFHSSLGPGIPGVDSMFYSHAVLVGPPRPLAYYRLEEQSGSTAFDSTQNGYTGTLSGGITKNTPGPLVGPGEVGSVGMTFNGSSGYIALPSRLSTTGWTQCSLECWIKLSSTLSSNPRLIANSHTDADNKGIQLFVNGPASGLGATGTVNFYLGNGSTAGHVTTTSALQVGVWAHICATWDGHTMTIFFNGDPQATASFSGNIASTPSPINLARNPAYSGDYFAGALDEVSITRGVVSSPVNHYLAGITPGGTLIGNGFPLSPLGLHVPQSGVYGGTYGYLLYTTIRAPKNTAWQPAASIGNDPQGNPVVRGFPQMTWSYSTLRPDYWYFFRQLYDLAGRTPPGYQYLVLIQYPAQQSDHAPIRVLARWDPPTHAYRQVGAYSGVQLKFTAIGQAVLDPSVPIVAVI